MLLWIFFSFLDGIQIYQVIILLLGIIPLIIEMFTPGFGVPGGMGIILLVAWYHPDGFQPPFEALVMIVILLIILGAALKIILHSAASGWLSKTLILNDSLTKSAGYIGTEGS